MIPAFLETPRLYLRPLVPADADGPYLRWFNDAEVCRYNSHHVFPYRREDALAYIEKVTNSHRELVLAIVQRSDQRHIGNISLQVVDLVSRTAELAIVIGEKDCWGEGFSKEAAQALVQHGFATMNLHRISCNTPIDNIPMRKLAGALGMQQEGIRRQALFKDGRYLDLVEYGILRNEYPAIDA
jgi:RimJ/RimL family protein N-acetyltransferase